MAASVSVIRISRRCMERPESASRSRFSEAGPRPRGRGRIHRGWAERGNARSAGMRHRIGSWERGQGGALLAAILILIGGSWALAARPVEHAVTRADLDAARRRVDRLEAEAALTDGRKPYIVLDLEHRVILVRLMGMTVREILLQETETRGLVPPSRDGSAPEPFTLAGIFALQEKEGDPRLSPLTPEQIEAALDHADAHHTPAPEPTAAHALRF